MQAYVIEIGNNLGTTLASLLALITLVYTGWQSRQTKKLSGQAKDLSGEAVRQLSTNGGSSSFDQLMAGQAEIKATLDEHGQRLDNLETHSIRTREGESHHA